MSNPAWAVELLHRALAHDEQAWAEIVRQFDEPIRATVRGLGEAIHPFTAEQVDDLMSDFWLRIVDEDFGVLRDFRGETDDSLLEFLRLQISRLVEQEMKRHRRMPPVVSLDEIRLEPQPPLPRHSSNPGGDLSGLAALLALPAEVRALREEVGSLRDTIEHLRVSLPPALLSVADAAKALDVAEVTVRRMIREGKLAHVRVGRAVRVDLGRKPTGAQSQKP